MPTERRFAAFGKGAVPPRMDSIPEGGMCISAFLVITKKGDPGHVLMGHISQKAAWDHIGALDAGRVATIAHGWMLPSSHLMLLETPEGAARRILREQLGVSGQRLAGPLTFADTASGNHWDLGFIYTGERETIRRNDAWDELKFVDVSELRPEAIVRSQGDVLAYAGVLKPKVSPTR